MELLERRAPDPAAFLNRASHIIASSLDLQTVLDNVAHLVVPELGDYSHIDLVDDTSGDLYRAAYAHVSPDGLAALRALGERYPPSLERRYATVESMLTGESRLCEEMTPDDWRVVAEDDEHLVLVETLAPRSFVVAPLTVQGRVLGAIIIVASHSERRYTAEDLALVEELARRIAIAVDHARLYDRERRARQTAEEAVQHVTRLQAVTAALSDAHEPAEVARIIVGNGLAALGAKAGSVAVLNERGDAIDLLGATGYSDDVLSRFSSIPLASRFPLTDAVRSGEMIVLADAAERGVRYPHLAELRAANGDGAMAAVPLVADGRIFGAIGINFRKTGQLTDTERDFLIALAHQCAQALDRAHLREAERAAYRAERAARLEAEAANQAKVDFLRTVSHELRQPLNGIGGFVDLLELELRGPLTQEQRDDLQRIRRNQQHLLVLINDILSFARMEAGQIDVASTPVPLDEALHSVDAMVGAQMVQRGIDFVYVPVDGPVCVYGDHDRIVQICLNLLTNAMRATASGGAIELTCDVDDTDVHVHVRDTGTGIPADKLEVIFSPFTQLGRALNQPREGAGLGLSIARGLAEAQGGTLTVTSTVGVGSTFTLTLRRAS
jgi:signal transduction histidine kinase